MEDNATVEETRKRANQIAAGDRALQQRRWATGREKVRQEWVEHFQCMARNHHDLAAEYAAKADALNGDDAA